MRWKNRTSGNPNTCHDQRLPWRCWFGSNHRTFLLLSALFFILGSMPEPFPSVNPPSRHTSLPPPGFALNHCQVVFLHHAVPGLFLPLHSFTRGVAATSTSRPFSSSSSPLSSEEMKQRINAVSLFVCLAVCSNPFWRPLAVCSDPPGPSGHLHHSISPPSSLHLCIIRPPNSCFSLSLTLLTQLDPLRQINAPLLAPSTPHPPRIISLEQVLINDMQHND